MQVQIAEVGGAIQFISSQSPLKNALPDSDAGCYQYQKTVDALAGVFIGAVANYRNTAPETVRSRYGNGGMMIGGEAVAAGMADKLGSLESLIAQLSGGKPLANAKQENPTLTCPAAIAIKPDTAGKPVANAKQGNQIMTTSLPPAIKPDTASALTGAGKWQYEWNHSAALQSEFPDMTTYVAYQKAACKGSIKQLAIAKQGNSIMTTSLPSAIKPDTADVTAAMVSTAALASGIKSDTLATADAIRAGKWQHEWKHSAALQSEFKTRAHYVAYQNAACKVSIKRL